MELREVETGVPQGQTPKLGSNRFQRPPGTGREKGKRDIQRKTEGEVRLHVEERGRGGVPQGIHPNLFPIDLNN